MIEMSLINCQILHQFFQRLQGTIQKKDVSIQMAKSLKIARIDSFEELEKIANHINKRFSLNHQQDEKKAEYIQDCRRKWVFGEYKLFANILVLNAVYNYISISEMKNQHFTFIYSIFKAKDIEFIRYQVAFIDNSRKIFRTHIWAHQQSHILRAIFAKQKNELSWRKIALLLYQKSQGTYFRIFSQCRQHWINHLNPKLKKAKWNPQQDSLLRSLIKQHGLRWSVISKLMGGVRSQHMVKNRYNSLKKLKSLCQQHFIQQKTNFSCEKQMIVPLIETNINSNSKPVVLENIFIQKDLSISKQTQQISFENLGFEGYLCLSLDLCRYEN